MSNVIDLPQAKTSGQIILDHAREVHGDEAIDAALANKEGAMDRFAERYDAVMATEADETTEVDEADETDE